MASYWAVIYLLIFSIVGTFTLDTSVPSLEEVKEMASRIQLDLVNHLNKKMMPSKLQDIYEQAVVEGDLTESYVDGNKLVDKVATNWVELLEKKKRAVKNIVEFLENSSLNATYEEFPDVDFLNANNITNESILDDKFGGKDVTFDMSAVQIPTDIYNEDPIILNAIKVTDGIDEIFINNREKDTDLLWQYVGSSTGFYRSYPGSRHEKRNKYGVDVLDRRKQSWYIGAANSPKDVLILVDMSGSTSGITSNLIKVSVSEAIDTLGDDDFVNVAMFNDNTTFLDPKLTTFVQANLRNKQHLKKQLKEYMENNATEEMANYTRALEFAFISLDKLMDEATTSDNGKGADCNSVILMFTDGGPDSGEEIIKKYNDQKRTRIFVYNVGPNAMVSSDGVKEMACLTNGYFSNIPSIGAVRLTTLDYIPVLSRPLVLAGNRTYQWSNIYLDALGLGMMTTLTLPAFNKTKLPDGSANQQLLGVVGTDVTIKGMENLVPKARPVFNSSYRCIGPEGYAFGINSNGYILIHPRLKGQEEIEPILKLGYLSDPPNVDLLEVEVIPKGSDDLVNLRKAMIDEMTNNVTFISLVMSKGERYVHNISMTYSYTNINATSFSMAIVQPKFDLYEFQVANSILSDNGFASILDQVIDSNFTCKVTANSTEAYIELVGGKDEEKRIGTDVYANWELCPGLSSTSTSEEVLQEIKQELEEMKSNSLQEFKKCDPIMVPCLLFDIKVVKEFEKDNDIGCLFDDDDGPKYLMIASKCGYTHIYPSWDEDDIASVQDPWEQTYYQRSLYFDGFVFAVPYKKDDHRYESGDDLEVTISMAIRVREVIPAVMSVILSYDQFATIWTNNVESCINSSIICYLIDDGGFLISTSADTTIDVGRFFGMFEGDIMSALTDKGVYDKEELYDFQASCESVDSIESFGIKSFYVPTIADFLNFNYVVTAASWSFVKQLFYQILSGDILSVFSQTTELPYDLYTTEEMVETVEESGKPGNESCIKLQKLWHFGRVASAEGNVSDCIQGGIRQWKAARLNTDDLNATNMLLVIVDAPDNSTTTCTSKVLRQEPQQDSGPKPEDEAKYPRYRRRPKNCFFNHSKEQHICSGGITISPSFWLMLLVVPTFLLQQRLM
ncbi:voltage-dependent calcium channel subunit alpha-2/delta-1-like isoform X3 [Antedon mediterranea]|uniref:voltage-dependent calcium channel subunit alpha-2/delta-1-like isoform X3 n=1 Tax=Antedon mediterranea TaxID=105859 RepID=UPI003AF55900